MLTSIEGDKTTNRASIGIVYHNTEEYVVAKAISKKSISEFDKLLYIATEKWPDCLYGPSVWGVRHNGKYTSRLPANSRGRSTKRQPQIKSHGIQIDYVIFYFVRLYNKLCNQHYSRSASLEFQNDVMDLIRKRYK